MTQKAFDKISVIDLCLRPVQFPICGGCVAIFESFDHSKSELKKLFLKLVKLTVVGIFFFSVGTRIFFNLVGIVLILVWMVSILMPTSLGFHV
jgi:hypothetical protein